MAQNSIRVKNYLNVEEELVAVAGITPGMLIEETAAGEVQVHSTSGGNAIPMFALENELEGQGITDAYEADDPVQCWFPQRGDQVYAYLAGDETAVIGDFLESDGAGSLKVHVADVESFESAEAGSITVYPLQIVGQAMEAVDLSDSDNLSAIGRIIIRIV